MAEYQSQGFFFTEDYKSPTNFAYIYQKYKRVIEKLQILRLETPSPPEFTNEYFALFCSLREHCVRMDFKKPKAKDWGITDERVTNFLQTDRYVSATMLLKSLAKEKNEKINEARRKILNEYKVKMEVWKDFTKGGQRKHE